MTKRIRRRVESALCGSREDWKTYRRGVHAGWMLLHVPLNPVVVFFECFLLMFVLDAFWEGPPGAGLALMSLYGVTAVFALSLGLRNLLYVSEDAAVAGRFPVSDHAFLTRALRRT